MSAVQAVRSRRIRCAASHWCKDISTRDSARTHLLPESALSVSTVKRAAPSDPISIQECFWFLPIADVNTGAFAYPCAGSIIARRVILTAAHCALAKAEGHRL